MSRSAPRSSDLRRMVDVALREQKEFEKLEAQLGEAIDRRDTPAVYALACRLLGRPPVSVK